MPLTNSRPRRIAGWACHIVALVGIVHLPTPIFWGLLMLATVFFYAPD